MKITIRLFLLVAIFSSFTFAGDQSTGGYVPCDPQVEVCPPPPPPECTENCGNGAVTANTGSTEADAINAIAAAITTAIGVVG